MAEIKEGLEPLTDSHLELAVKLCEFIGEEVALGEGHAILPLREMADVVDAAPSTVKLVIDDLIEKKVVLRHPGMGSNSIASCYHGAGEPW